MDKITLETDLLDRLGKASAFVASLPTEIVTPSRQIQDISRSRFHDVSARRGLLKKSKIQPTRPVTDKIGQELIKELVGYFE